MPLRAVVAAPARWTVARARGTRPRQMNSSLLKNLRFGPAALTVEAQHDRHRRAQRANELEQGLGAARPMRRAGLERQCRSASRIAPHCYVTLLRRVRTDLARCSRTTRTCRQRRPVVNGVEKLVAGARILKSAWSRGSKAAVTSAGQAG